MPEFETFKKRMVPLAKEPYVTIQKRGTMSFNAAAHAALGTPTAIELLYDRNERIIGIRAVEETVEHAYPIRSVGEAGKAGSFVVSGRAFTQYYGIDTSISRRYKTDTTEDGTLCIDLKSGGTEIIGARSKLRQKPEQEVVQAAFDEEPPAVN